jgi:hypothetical protein
MACRALLVFSALGKHLRSTKKRVSQEKKEQAVAMGKGHTSDPS